MNTSEWQKNWPLSVSISIPFNDENLNKIFQTWSSETSAKILRIGNFDRDVEDLRVFPSVVVSNVSALNFVHFLAFYHFLKEKKIMLGKFLIFETVDHVKL